MKKHKLLVKIIVPILIAISLAIIWNVKTHPTADGSVKGSSGESASTQGNPDFLLDASSIDLGALTEYNLPIIIDFGADACIPCKEMAPVLKTLNAEMQGKAIIKFVDVWKHRDAAKDFPLQVIPTQVFINADGTAYVPSEELGIEFTMYSKTDTNEHVFTVHQGGLTEDQMRSILADMGVTDD